MFANMIVLVIHESKKKIGEEDFKKEISCLKNFKRKKEEISKKFFLNKIKFSIMNDNLI